MKMHTLLNLLLCFQLQFPKIWTEKMYVIHCNHVNPLIGYREKSTYVHFS